MLGMVSMAFTQKSKALEYYPRKSDKKWAVLFATWCGSSRDAAIWISEGMDDIADVFDVRENTDLSVYDHVVVGSSIRGFKIRDDLTSYIEKNKSILKNKTHGLFDVCGNMMKPVTDERRTNYIEQQLATMIGVENVPGDVFLGRITFGLLDEESKKMLKGFDMPE
jgi:menaquinone-dependent protoporphyrinogen IX oxidase